MEQWLRAQALRPYNSKLELNDHQATLMAKHAGYARKVFNWGLRLWMLAYQEERGKRKEERGC